MNFTRNIPLEANALQWPRERCVSWNPTDGCRPKQDGRSIVLFVVAPASYSWQHTSSMLLPQLRRFESRCRTLFTLSNHERDYFFRRIIANEIDCGGYFDICRVRNCGFFWHFGRVKIVDERMSGAMSGKGHGLCCDHSRHSRKFYRRRT